MGSGRRHGRALRIHVAGRYALRLRALRPCRPSDGGAGGQHAGIDPVAAQDQGRHYAAELKVPFAFLSNGKEVWFLDPETDAHASKIAGFYSEDDLERRIAARRIRRDLSGVETDRRIVDRQLGLTATPCTVEPHELPDPEDG